MEKLRGQVCAYSLEVADHTSSWGKHPRACRREIIYIVRPEFCVQWSHPQESLVAPCSVKGSEPLLGVLAPQRDLRRFLKALKKLVIQVGCWIRLKVAHLSG